MLVHTKTNFIFYIHKKYLLNCWVFSTIQLKSSYEKDLKQNPVYHSLVLNGT